MSRLRLRTIRLTVVVAALEGFTGLAFYGFPREFGASVYDPIRPVLSWFAALLLAGAVLLVMPAYGRFLTTLKRWAYFAATLPLVMLATIFAANRAWTGTVIYGSLAVFLLGSSLARVKDTVESAPDLFAFAAGTINVVVGLLLLLLPKSFNAPPYAPIQGILTLVGFAGIVGGAALILPVERGRWADPRGILQLALGAILPAVLVYSFLRSGTWTGVLSWGAMPLAYVFRRGRLTVVDPMAQAAPTDPLTSYHGQISGWSGVLALFFVVLTAVGEAGAVADPLPVTVLVLGISIYGVLDRWFWPLFAGLPSRILGYLLFTTAAVGLLYAGAGPAGRGLLILLAIIPAVGAGILGPKAGGTVALVSLAMVALGLVDSIWRTGAVTAVALTRFLVDALLLGAATSASLSAMLHQRRLQADLQVQTAELQAQQEELQTQTEELHAQQEELQAQNEELLLQGGQLASQRDLLLQALTRAQAIAEDRDRLIAILEATPDYVALEDAAGNRLFMNRAGRAMLEIPDDGADDGAPQVEGYPEWARKIIMDEGIPAAARDGSWHGETALLTHSGREIPVSQVIVAHKSSDGTVLFVSTIARDISERKQIEAQLLHLATFDPLTDLFNRRRFQEELEHQIAQAERYDRQGALLYLDLDEFKGVNDRLGHGAGDELLKSISSLLRQRLRKTDTVARLGGDEFAILLSEVDGRRAEEIAGEIIKAIRAHRAACGACTVAVTGSIGIALFPDQGTTAAELMSRADMAMYQAKQQGRDGYCRYTAGRTPEP